MKNAKVPGRILWALDPFTSETALVNKTGRVLGAWCSKRGVVVEPIGVLSPDQIGVSVGIFARVVGDMRPLVEKRLSALVERAPIRSKLAPTVLVSDSFSLKSSVRALLDYAHQVQAELIVVASRSRRGAKRLFSGSFAETLALRSSLPLLIVTPRTSEDGRFRKILFATDLSPRSRQAFTEVVKLAKQHRAKLSVFHKAEYMVNAWVPAVGGTIIQQKWIDADLARQKKELAAFVAEARGAGVVARAIFDRDVGSVAERIGRAVRNTDGDLVALASESGALTAALLGSASRQTLRASTVPMWIVHPETKETP